MNTVPMRRVLVLLTGTLGLLGATATLASLAAASGYASAKTAPQTVQVRLSEWKVQLTPARIPAGPVRFEVTNAGTIPHAFEVEGKGLEKSTPQIRPGAKATLDLDLRAGNYEAYCPVGKDSHKMLGMINHLAVAGDTRTTAATGKAESGEKYAAGDDDDDDDAGKEQGMAGMTMSATAGAKRMAVTGGGPVIQILPGPFPFADSALAVIDARPADQKADLLHKSQEGPYSNNVAATKGDISLVAIDRGAVGDSVSGEADFTGNDGARWKVVIDRVQTKDIPFNPRFGGVIMGLFYHGASGVHTPLVPTIQSSLALWAFAHLYKNDQLVTDNAMVHIMLLSRTRRPGDWALDCWDCSNQPIEELQLQVTPAPNTPPFAAPGGFLFVNWEQSSGKLAAL
jgi:hypothetical protein